MRTTVDLDETTLAAARSLIADREMSGNRISLGTAIDELVRWGLLNHGTAAAPNGFPVLRVINPTHVVTSETVKQHQDD